MKEYKDRHPSEQTRTCFGREAFEQNMLDHDKNCLWQEIINLRKKESEILKSLSGIEK